jgi:flavin reductase (DIM6/NTAB) family NADH-FMN oxidoreductase RutF
MDELPHWPEGTAGVLSTVAGGAPHAIPVSLVLRAGPRELLVGLAPRRGSLENLRAEPACAVTVMAAGGVAFTAHGRAVAFEEAAAVIAVRVEVERIADHDHPTFAIDDGVRWRWTDQKAIERDGAARSALRALLSPRRS